MEQPSERPRGRDVAGGLRVVAPIGERLADGPWRRRRCEPGHTRCMTAGQATVRPKGLENIRYLRYCLDIARPNVNLVGEAWNGQDANGSALAPQYGGARRLRIRQHA